MMPGISAAQSPAAFASRHFGALDLGDRRLSRRAERVAAAMASCPHASLPRQCGDSHQAKGAYRLFNHDAVTSDSISRKHRDLTLEEASGQDVVLFIQDTTELSFGESRAGVGPIGYGDGAHGLLMHSTLAITPTGDVLGLGELKIWARGPVRRGESQAKRRVREGRESLRWKEAIEAVGAPPAGSRWIHVGDREADVWETFVAAMEVGSDCVIRACGAASKRKAAIGHDEQTRPEALDALARALPQSGECEVARHARPGAARRRMRLCVSFAPVTVHPPRLVKGDEPLALWVVRAWEEEASTEWVIMTTLPVLDVTDALSVLGHYQRRWTIEEYHKCLKTGCRIEARQLQDRARLEPLAAMLAVVALRLLNLKHVAKLTPTAPATDAVPEAYVRVLSKLRGIPESELTCRRFWRETAKLGGFLGRNSDGDPGWQTLWLGWHDLEMILKGARVAQPSRYG